MPDLQNLSPLPNNIPCGNDWKQKSIDQFICSVEHRLSPTQYRILNELRTYIDLMEASIVPTSERKGSLLGEISIHINGIGIKGALKLQITEYTDTHPLISRGSVDLPIAGAIQINYGKLSESQLHVLLTISNMVNRYIQNLDWLDYNTATSRMVVVVNSPGVNGHIEFELHQ